MDTDNIISTALVLAKTVLYQTILLSKALHHEFPIVYDAFKYIVAAYVCYKTALFAVRSLYSTVLWIIRMTLIAYAVYIVICVFSAIDASISMSTNTNTSTSSSTDMEIVVDAAVRTAIRETKRLYTVGKLLATGLATGVAIMYRRLMRDDYYEYDASPTQLARDLLGLGDLLGNHFAL